MLLVKLVYFVIVLIEYIQSTSPALHLYYSNTVSENDIQHDCLYVDVGYDENARYEKLPFCLSESVAEFQIELPQQFPSFSFAKLQKLGITSENLYDWSAPIDLIEDYQFYLTQSITADDMKIFSNCTLPRFGPLCQYQFALDHSDGFDTLFDIIDLIYMQYNEIDMNWTCYEHMECDYHLAFGCLDWTEICDGYTHCLNDGIDEKYCSQLELHQCQSNEIRCSDGQCVPWEFIQKIGNDQKTFFHCSDKTDKLLLTENIHQLYSHPGIDIQLDEYTCPKRILTSSCLHQRHTLLFQQLFSIQSESTSDSCWLILKCIFYLIEDLCGMIDWDDLYSAIEIHCPDMMFVPAVPILFDQIYFAYAKNYSLSLINRNILHLFLCTNHSYYQDYFSENLQLFINNTRCYQNLTIHLDDILDDDKQLLKHEYGSFHRFQSSLNICNQANVYQCRNSSKCISIHRLMDFISDCPYFDDENPNILLSKTYPTNHYHCLSTKKFIPKIWWNNQICDCDQCDDEPTHKHLNQSKVISFQMICDGFTDAEHDENQCEHWPCDTIYTHCDGVWDCINGEDELGCDKYSPLSCSSMNHVCVSSKTNELICVSSKQINDGHVDCLGGIDESKFCRMKENFNQLSTFYCQNEHSNRCINYSNICDGFEDCLDGDDEQLCLFNDSSETSLDKCLGVYRFERSDNLQILCEYIRFPKKERRLDFQFRVENNSLLTKSKKINSNLRRAYSSALEYEYRCHRGVDLIVWFNSQTNASRRTCLCPPSHYGNVCQYQNERINLILYFHSSLDSRQTLFTILVSLIDDSDQRTIHSYHKLIYIYSEYCDLEYYIHLVYSTRPKNMSRIYSIHLDIYEQHSLTYRGSYLYPISFSFLPVHRLALVVSIPSEDEQIRTCSPRHCHYHGKCTHYFNHSESATFCRCDRGWSGRFCHIPQHCNCALDAIYAGVWTSNRSVCICPHLKHGPRCLVTESVCRSNQVSKCENGGTCIPLHSSGFTSSLTVCLCPRGYYGSVCESIDYNISLIFDEQILLPEAVLIHFIRFRGEKIHRSTIFKKISYRNQSLLLHWSHSYNLVFIEFFKTNYYLVAKEPSSETPLTLTKMVNSSDRCLHVNELVNQTIAEYSFVHRVKFYHWICARYSTNLSCFYDQTQFCLCYNHFH